MGALTYLDLDLQIERSGTGYRARVVNSPAGQAAADFTLPFSDLELENFLLRMGRARAGMRRMESSQLEAAKSFGGKLFAAVFQDEIRSVLRSSLDEAERQNAGLRVRLHLSGTAELADLPWEYLYHPSLNRFLALSNETPLVRYLDLPEIIRPLAVTPPLRLLALISTPRDYELLDVEREWGKLRGAVQDLEQRGLILVERLDTATLPALQQKLRQAEYHILHYVGHGGFDEQAQDGVLVLEDENGNSRSVSAQNLGMILHDHRSLRLVVLNACEGARSSRADPFAGVAPSLIQQRIPAVIAMQFEISDGAAITFSHEFYAALADGYPVDAALAEARKSIFAQGNEVEWATPVLYLRAPNGQIFDIQAASPADRTRLQIAAWLSAAQTAAAANDWPQAADRARAILALAPAHADAERILAQAQAHAVSERAPSPPPARDERAPVPTTAPERTAARPLEPPPPVSPGLSAAAQGPPARSRSPILLAAGGMLVLFLLIVGFAALNGFGQPATPTASSSGFLPTTAPTKDGAAALPTPELAVTPTNLAQVLPPATTPLPIVTRTPRPTATNTPRLIIRPTLFIAPTFRPVVRPTNTPHPESTFLIYGRVVDEDNVPIEGNTIAMLQGDTRIDVDSAADGAFQSPVPRGGVWNVQIVGISCPSRLMNADCNLSGYVDSHAHNINVTLPLGQPIIFIYQKATAVLRGVVRDRAGRPVGDQRVNGEGPNGVWAWVNTHAGTGEFQMPVIAGDWQVYAVNFSPRVEGAHIRAHIPDGPPPDPILIPAP